MDDQRCDYCGVSFFLGVRGVVGGVERVFCSVLHRNFAVEDSTEAAPGGEKR